MIITRTEEAKADIKEIYSYSFTTFGEAQAEKYYEGLEAKINAILDGFAHYVDCSELIEGMRRIQCQKHFIYYQQTNKNEILIVRILDQRMDEVRHFQ